MYYCKYSYSVFVIFSKMYLLFHYDAVPTSKYSNRRFARQSAHQFFPAAGSLYETPSFLAMKVALESFPNCTVKV